jgi:hypothetical protein
VSGSPPYLGTLFLFFLLSYLISSSISQLPPPPDNNPPKGQWPCGGNGGRCDLQVGVTQKPPLSGGTPPSLGQLLPLLSPTLTAIVFDYLRGFCPQLLYAILNRGEALFIGSSVNPIQLLLLRSSVSLCDISLLLLGNSVSPCNYLKYIYIKQTTRFIDYLAQEGLQYTTPHIKRGIIDRLLALCARKKATLILRPSTVSTPEVFDMQSRNLQLDTPPIILRFKEPPKLGRFTAPKQEVITKAQKRCYLIPNSLIKGDMGKTTTCYAYLYTGGWGWANRRSLP